MRRGRVQLKLIENKINRQVTFSKRRTGIVKKAHEISVLCDVDVALIIFSASGKMFEYTNCSMEKILERYERRHYAQVATEENKKSQEDQSLEHERLKTTLEMLKKNQRNLTGEDLDFLGIKEILQLEPQLHATLKQIRSAKDKLMANTISELQRKGKMMEEKYLDLERKVKDLDAVTNRTLLEQNSQSEGKSALHQQSISFIMGSHSGESGEKVEEQVAQEQVTQALPSPKIIIPPWMLPHVLNQ